MGVVRTTLVSRLRGQLYTPVYHAVVDFDLVVVLLRQIIAVGLYEIGKARA